MASAALLSTDLEKILISVLGAIVGFLLSQSVNIVRYFRRPRFRTTNFEDGVLNCYTGSPPETPSEVTFGFYLQNNGYNPAKNTRIFVSELRSADNPDGKMEESLLEFSELKRPVDIIPPGETIMVRLGTVRSDQQHLDINYQEALEGEDVSEPDTRHKKAFSAKFHIHCDDVNSSTILQLRFCPAKGGWAYDILHDMEPPPNPWEKLQASLTD